MRGAQLPYMVAATDAIWDTGTMCRGVGHSVRPLPALFSYPLQIRYLSSSSLGDSVQVASNHLPGTMVRPLCTCSSQGMLQGLPIPSQSSTAVLDFLARLGSLAPLPAS